MKRNHDASPLNGRDSFTAVRNDQPSNAMATSRMPMAQPADSSSWGWRSFSMPSYRANAEPRVNSTIDTTKAQKKRSRPKPNGCWRVATRAARRPPTSSRTWLPVSATEWMLSASIELDPVNRKPANLATAIPRLAMSAAMMARVDPPVDMGSV